MIENVHDRIPGGGKPLLVAVAGKGGVGKTSVAAALMGLMSAKGLRMLAVDADPTALLGTYLGASLRGTVGRVVEDARHAVRGGVVTRPREMVASEIQHSLVHTPYGDLLTMGASSGRGCYCASNSAVRDALQELVARGAGGNGYDVLLVDCEPGLEIFSRGTLDGADELVIVAEPTAAALLVAAQIWQTAGEAGLRAAYARQQGEVRPILLNKLKESVADPQEEIGEVVVIPPHIRALLVQYQLEAEWLVPFDRSVAEAIEHGQPATRVGTKSGFMLSVDSLASHLARLARANLAGALTVPR